MKINQLSKSVGIGVFFLFANLNAQSNEKIIRNFINTDVSFKNKSGADFKIQNEDKSGSLNAEIVNIQQYYNNTPIYKSLAKAVIRDGKVLSLNNNFRQIGNNSIIADKIDKTEALSTALRSVDIKDTGFELLDEKNGDLINLPDNQVASIRFYFERNNSLIPAQLFFINQTKENKFYGILVSLTDGEILEKNNMIDECKFEDNHFAGDTDSTSNHLLTHFNTSVTKKNQTKAATDASYNVFPFPVEAPTFGSRAIVTNPWDLTASPEGWHSNGTSNFSNTYGNNVLAYVDNNASNTAGFSPVSTTTGSLTFDFPFEESASLSAYDNRASAVTNLFYANNMIHDIMYKFGFTESTRNFQSNNFGKGGAGNDAVRAEAFDGSGYNNANFASGYEILNGNGSYTTQAPRMQMYLWNYSVPVKKRLFYTDPTLATRPTVNTGAANFGRPLMETGITGDIIIPSVASGCTALTAGSLTGKIAMVNTTGCGYNIKAKTVQDAGAIGMIVHRTTSNSVTDMNVSNVTNVSIPSIMIPKDEGDFITAELTAGRAVNVNLKDLAVGYKNSSFDNGVMIHEYGHGVSNRLTGQGYSCLTNLEQMGEGWSDFFALMLTNTPSYTATTGRGIATYSVNTAPTALGIRSYRYTTDMSANPFTYGDTNTTGGQPHAVGQIWATMLWDLHWKMAEKYGYNYDVTADPNSGSAKTLQLVMDGLKLQPCNPNFVSGRDAILQADQLAGGADNCLIWNVFARRGLGVNASAGTASSITDQVENFDVPEACILATEDIAKNKAFGIYPNPAKGEFFIKTAPTVGNTTVKVEILDLNGKLVKSLERKKNSSDSISTKGLTRGTYLVVITENGKSNAEKLIVE
ncbi:T9SS-dependent M36 family metallopeptidase [Epilithonimonas arachidiradicis]|uniref:Peptidase M36 n=1 Tax=Epilithonimonas arachidiradicis TaxID=1617282 RepID=A0A420DB43_9FLAO|nr:T9SS-dependent M36 family metallopeptidase [Epilithonimonas arachidiradicis]RKE88189.1 putative secreted protein (Por secretion system target) [Epilithonimonas arachidiradicis]GGG50662.1 peptidase M36 [Epilithonimonas arachidiradicis]